jgi:hypothetical protein
LETFNVKAQVPRSTITTRLVRLAAIGSQASLVGATPSLTTTPCWVMLNVCKPKLAAPRPSGNVREGAGVVVRVRFGKPFHTYICMRGGVPSAKVLMLALLPTPSSALSCAST